MSNYVQLMIYRKESLEKGDKESADQLWAMIQDLIDSNVVTEEEFNQIDYF
jgi:hypothetical protein